jgi:LysR family glycine cleavage system transcriptional activator
MKRVLPPLNTLLAFEAAARLGSMSAAARELGLTQPAVSLRLQQLEGFLGEILFERSRRGLALTPSGRFYARAVAGALDQLGEAGTALSARADQRTLRIAANFGFAQLWLMPRVARLRAAFPQALFRLTTSDRDRDLDDEDCDLAIRFGAGAWPGWTATPLLPEIVFPVCAPAYLQARPDLASGPAEAARLMGETLLHMDEASDRWLTWASWAEAHGVQLPAAKAPFLYSNYPLLLQAALSGEGIALGWAGLVDDLVASGALVRLMPDYCRPRHGYHLARRDGLTAPRPLVRQVSAWLLAEAGTREAEERDRLQP